VPTGNIAKRSDIAGVPFAVENVGPLWRMGYSARVISALPSRLWLREYDRDLAEFLLKDLRSMTGQFVPKFISVDIFDTLLLRNGKCESRRFWEISELVREKISYSKLGNAFSTAELFVARCLAMRAGYACSDTLGGCREGHILQVLATQLEMLGLPADAQVLLMDAELEFETVNLQCNDFLLAVLQEAFPSTPIVGLSDTYLGGAQIQILIDRLCAGRCRMEAIYSSADIIFNKRTGRAFAHVAQDRRCTCSDILHIGDNVTSDLIQARLAGCRAQLFPVAHAELDARCRDLNAFLEERRSEGFPAETYAML